MPGRISFCPRSWARRITKPASNRFTRAIILTRFTNTLFSSSKKARRTLTTFPPRPRINTVAQSQRGRKPRSLHAHEERRISRRRAHVALKDRHGFAEHLVARPPALSHP